MLTLVNSLDHIFDFSSREWKWLAKEHQLELKDLNSDRRKYGRFGKPGEEQTVPMPGRTEVESTVTSETVDVISTVEETDLSPVEDTDIPPVEDKLPEDK